MRNVRGSRHSLPNTRTLTIIAQDPSVRIGRRILTSKVEIPAEDLLPGPRGYRVNVIDYDVTTNTLYQPAVFEPLPDGNYQDPFALPDRPSAARLKKYEDSLLNDPRFHAQNVYAIVMRILARFEFALGRRVSWGCDGHQLHVAPHAFADANAFYSRADRGLFFGYFAGSNGKPIFTCLSHDIVAHETTHALLDGLRGRYMEPSSPDQAAFHEGFADVVALLSVFSLKDIVGQLLDMSTGAAKLVDERHLSAKAIRKSVLLGLADEMGQELSRMRGEALRRSVELPAGKPYMSMPEYQEPHRRGELLVASVMNAFVEIWISRLEKIGYLAGRKKDRSLVVEEGGRVAAHLLTMAIRALDYCPPTDINFSDYLSALLTVDSEVVPDDTKYNYRDALLRNFAGYGIKPASTAGRDGMWLLCDQDLIYSRTHFDSMLTDREEVFRFIWENRTGLDIHKDGYIEVESVRPCHRIGPDGFILRETVAEYVQILTLQAGELKAALKIDPPADMPSWKRVRIFGGGALVFNEYGQLKYQIKNSLEEPGRQTARLHYLWANGFFDEDPEGKSHFAEMHLARATM